MKEPLLSSADVIGRRIIAVYHEDERVIRRFQQRAVVVELDTGVFFNLARIKVLDGKLVQIAPRAYGSACKRVLTRRQDPNLESPIRAFVSSEWFFSDAGILLQNGFVLEVGVSEWEEGYRFFEAPASMAAGFSDLTIDDPPMQRVNP